MFLVTIVCSDSDCIEELEIAVDELDEVEGQICDCGHGFVVVSVAKLDEPQSGSLISLPGRRPAPSRRAA